MTDRDSLIESAIAAMRASGRIPEPAVLASLSDDMLRNLIAYYTGPVVAA
jgi:hypothetical protein